MQAGNWLLMLLLLLTHQLITKLTLPNLLPPLLQDTRLVRTLDQQSCTAAWEHIREVQPSR